MKSDIEIASHAKLEPITNIAKKLGISDTDIEQYGKYKAKLSEDVLRDIEKNDDGKLVLVTAINPTPAGEGKTTTSVGLAQALWKKGKKSGNLPLDLVLE